MSTRKTTKKAAPRKRASTKTTNIDDRLHAIDIGQEEMLSMLARAQSNAESRIIAMNERLGLFERRIDALLAAQERTEAHYERAWRNVAAGRDLLAEVNAHMWQTQNRLNAVRDLLWKREQAKRSPWARLVQWFKKIITR